MKNTQFLLMLVSLLFVTTITYAETIETEFFTLTLPSELSPEWNKNGTILAGLKKAKKLKPPFLIIYYAHANDKKYRTVGKNTKHLIKRSLKFAKSTTYKQFGIEGPEKIERNDGIIEYRKSFSKNNKDQMVSFIHILLGVEKGVVDLRYTSNKSMKEVINYAENIIKTIRWK